MLKGDEQRVTIRYQTNFLEDDFVDFELWILYIFYRDFRTDFENLRRVSEKNWYDFNKPGVKNQLTFTLQSVDRGKTGHFKEIRKEIK